MVRNNLYKLLTVTTIFIFINLIKSETAYLEVSSNNVNIISFYTAFDLKSIENSDYYQEESFSIVGKICSELTIDNLLTNCFYKFENYNYNWVRFLLNWKIDCSGKSKWLSEFLIKLTTRIEKKFYKSVFNTVTSSQ